MFGFLLKSTLVNTFRNTVWLIIFHWFQGKKDWLRLPISLSCESGDSVYEHFVIMSLEGMSSECGGNGHGDADGEGWTYILWDFSPLLPLCHIWVMANQAGTDVMCPLWENECPLSEDRAIIIWLMFRSMCLMLYNFMYLLFQKAFFTLE